MAKSIALTDRERRVLTAMTLRADASMKEIGRRAGVKEHTARYIRERLIKNGIIQPVYLIDNYRLGYTDFGVFLTRGAESSSGRKSFEKRVEGMPQVYWLSSTTGDFQYGLSFLAHRAYELDDFFSLIRPPGQGAYFEKLVGPRVDWTIYAPKYLCPDLQEETEITMSCRDEVLKIDQADHDLLTALAAQPDGYPSTLARLLRTSPAAILYRLEKLKERGLLRCQMYLIHLEKLGILTYRMLLVERSLSDEQKVKFREYCASYPNVAVLLRCTGGWDYEIRFETADPEDLDRFCRTIFDRFGAGIGSLRIVQQLRVLKRYAYPGSSRNLSKF